MLEAVAEGFARASADVEREQAVRGLDSRSELMLHVLIHESLRDAGFGVFPEQRFPMDRFVKQRSMGARCDVVLTQDGRPLVSESVTADDAVALSDAAWVEVKTVAQWKEGGPNHAYARTLQGPVWKDVSKLAKDEALRHAAVLLVLFTASETVAEHDLDVWSQRAALRGLPLWPRTQRHVPIGDRLGNAVCTLSIFPLEKR